MNNYTEQLKEFIGPPQDGRKDFFDLTHEESIAHIKSSLKNAFSVNLWTYKWPTEQIAEVDKELFDEGIVHCWDEVFDSFVCFNSYEDMLKFYIDLRKQATEEQLQDLREKGYNTPVTRWFEKVDDTPTSNRLLPDDIIAMVK